ncbi:hypothetical protein [Streptomyces sp. E-08]|uniref:hypothetical protein n=1 Tax=Streptomyces sp. E-08 TaxID=3404047 RepID=UPI003CF9CF79
MRFLHTRATLAAAVTAATAATPLVPGSSGATTATADPNIPTVCADRRPEPADPGAYGMQLDAAYRKNPRCGNRTSWMGARMPLFIPKPVEQGGRYAFAAMGATA